MRVLPLIMLFLICGFALALDAWAKDHAVGVRNGDWVRYTVTVTSPMPEAPTPSSVELEILRVVGKNVTMRLRTRKQNGTETNQTHTVDLAGAVSSGYTFVILANLTVGDSVSLNGDMRNITTEAKRTFAGANRTVIGTTFSDHGNTYSYYFDKQTGIAMELIEVSAHWSAYTMAEDTNIWRSYSSGPDKWLWMIVIVVPVVVIAFLAFRLQRRRPHHSRKILECA